MKLILVAAGAYVVGSIPFSYLVTLGASGEDVRRHGSGNVGATNVLRVAGRLAAFTALVLDVGKGVLAVAVARHLELPPWSLGLVAAVVVVGHVSSVFLRFGGGKGVATAAGALGALALLPALASALTFLLVVAWTRYVSLASVVAVLLYPVYVVAAAHRGLADAEPGFLVGALFVPLLVVLRHRGNLRRLLDGTERRLGEGRT